jgi:two-component system NtrC family sensor kinase
MSDFYFPDGQKKPVLAISNIITARRTGLPLGVLVGRYQRDSLDKLLHLERETMSESDKVYIINRQGLLLTVPKFFFGGADEVILKRRIESSSIIKAQENIAQIRGIYKDFRGERVLGASMLMEYNDWIILAEEDAEKVFAPLYRLTWQIIIIALISLCAAAGASFLIVRLERNIAGKAKQLEESRQVMFQAEKMAAVGQISSSIAHEISNPLTGVLNNVQLMKMVMAERNGSILKDYAQILNAIEESAMRCTDISRSLLDFSRASSGKFQPLSLNDAVDRAVILAEKEARSRNIFIEKELLPDLPAISGDFQLISQAIFDLVNNAQYAVSKADKKGSGWIFIKTHYQPQEDKVACIISDNGTGISEENLKKIFAPFFTTKPAGEGTGLGLSIVRDIIARHSGSIAVESQINKGTSFRIILPAFRKEE